MAQSLRRAVPAASELRKEIMQPGGRTVPGESDLRREVKVLELEKKRRERARKQAQEERDKEVTRRAGAEAALAAVGAAGSGSSCAAAPTAGVSEAAAATAAAGAGARRAVATRASGSGSDDDDEDDDEEEEEHSSEGGLRSPCLAPGPGVSTQVAPLSRKEEKRRDAQERRRAEREQITRRQAERQAENARLSASAVEEPFVGGVPRSGNCEKCGFKFRFPNLAVRYVYRQCPLCLYSIPEPAPLGVPAPHPSVPDRLPWPLCDARVCEGGVAKRCERRRVGGTDLCSKHQQVVKRFGKLSYGRFTEPYAEPHALEFDPPEVFDLLAVEPSAAERETARLKTLDEKAIEAARLDKEQMDKGSHDTMLLRTASGMWQRRVRRGQRIAKPISTKQIVDVVQPTFGIDLAEQGAGKVKWLRESFQALMALPTQRLAVLAAAVGHVVDPQKGLDVTEQVQGLIAAQHGHRLVIPHEADLLALLKVNDPCPGEKKWLRVRYSLDGVIAEVRVGVIRHVKPRAPEATPADPREQQQQQQQQQQQERDDEFESEPEPEESPFAFALRQGDAEQVQGPAVFRLERTLCLELPVAASSSTKTLTTRLTIIKGFYGHLHDPERRFNVTEKLQGLCDLGGSSSYFAMDKGLRLSDSFGEPCALVAKVLDITYKVEGREGEVVVPEAHGYLVDDVRVMAPIFAPAIVVLFATLSPRGLVGRAFVAKSDAKTRLLNYNIFDKAAKSVGKTSIRCLDAETVVVTDEVMELVNGMGGDLLEVRKGEHVTRDVLRAMGRARADALSGRFKGKDLVLEVEFRANGKLNTIKLNTDVHHLMADGILVDAKPVEPAIDVQNAVYGHPTDPARQANVTPVIQGLIARRRGRVLAIPTSEPLDKLFGDPCYPHHVNKVLQIRYLVRPILGQLAAAVTLDGVISQSIKIGWPSASDSHFY
jgi:hypothetical protein